MVEGRAIKSLVGSDIIGLITVGMYDHPLSIYREYIQNAADAISSSTGICEGRVEINIDPRRLRIKIRDNGPGLSHREAVRALLPIGRSEKQRGTDRGFRGIGRLSGLAFAQSVAFLTRSQPDQPVTRIVWDGSILRNHSLDKADTDRVIRNSVNIETLPGSEYPDHFFEAQIVRVARHAAGWLLNRDAVRSFISEVCPVPMPRSFPFASAIDNLFSDVEPPLMLNVFLEDELVPITRQYGKTIRFSDDREDQFREFEEFHIPSLGGNGPTAVGWISHSSYLGAIPKKAGIRGLRVRAGNIQIGNERILDHLFPEDRFNRWCVGEIHVTDPQIVPNARRDYFEPGPHVRNFENRLGAVIRSIATRCRKASAARNRQRKLLTALCEIDDTYNLAISGYLSPDDSRALVENALNRMQHIRANLGSMNNHAKACIEKLTALEEKLSKFQVASCHTPFGDMPKVEVSTYWRIFQALASVSRSPGAAKEVIEAVLSRA